MLGFCEQENLKQNKKQNLVLLSSNIHNIELNKEFLSYIDEEPNTQILTKLFECVDHCLLGDLSTIDAKLDEIILTEFRPQLFYDATNAKLSVANEECAEQFSDHLQEELIADYAEN